MRYMTDEDEMRALTRAIAREGKMKRFRVYYRWPGDTVESYFTVYAKDEQDAFDVFMRGIMTPEEAKQVVVTRIVVQPNRVGPTE